MTTITPTPLTTRELSSDELDAELATELPIREEMSGFHFHKFHQFHHEFRHHECYESYYCYEPYYESCSSPIVIRPLEA